MFILIFTVHPFGLLNRFGCEHIPHRSNASHLRFETKAKSASWILMSKGHAL